MKDNMKNLLCFLTLGLLCITQVQSLRCYTCEGDPNCKTETECPPDSMYCRTEVTAQEFSRTCEEMCVPSYKVNCCMEDLCSV